MLLTHGSYPKKCLTEYLNILFLHYLFNKNYNNYYTTKRKELCNDNINYFYTVN